ncbi:MAG TPA: putative 2OG-Fe(II) oxygenase [Rhizomicrobium sp.]|jgi:hypothetical protein|nr:putative 2OG-Fe(II) oxygenase [Rhizomicrobium sp.]
MRWLEPLSWKNLAAAEQLAQVALARQPTASGAWRSLIQSQKKMGKTAQADANIEKAAAAFGDDPAGRTRFVALLLETDEFDRALAAADALPPGAAADALLRQAALGSQTLGPVQRRVLADDELTFNQAWRAAQTPDQLHALIARCRAQLAQNPIHTEARCVLAHALARTGRADDAGATMALDSLTQISQTGDAALREALTGEIKRNPTLVPDPRNKATRDGLQTGRLDLPGDAAVAALVAHFKTAVEAYIAAMAGRADPWIASAPASATLFPWAVVYGAAGRQTAHRHPAGWLSGVYYVSAPREDDGYRGALLLGEPDKDLGVPAPWGVQRIEPIPGRLVLFPSFVTHATDACGSDGQRISIAFDVMPAAAE